MAGAEDISFKKRGRSSNWDEEEKRLLRQLVLERIDVIENKDTSTNTNMKKKASWQEILSCFNSLNNKKRDLKELQTQWRNTKGKVKSRESTYKRAKLMTGGGPPPQSPPPEDREIIEAIPNEFIVDINQFDSDSVHMKKALTSETVKLTPINDPWTPLPGTSNQKETKEITEDEGHPEQKEGMLCSTPKHVQNTYTKKKCIPKKNKINDENYERELFLLVKKSKEREIERAEEIHQSKLREIERGEEIDKRKIAILDLEYEYWKKKLNNIE